MKLPRALPGLLVFALLASATPAAAQYMYLDSNGDGVHTAADQVNPNGPTVIDIWLDTDSNRDGSPAVCSVDPQANFRINSYEFVLKATGGTMSWGTFTNLQPTMGLHYPPLNTETEYGDGYASLSYLPPGTYHLGTLQATLATGTPSIQFIPTPTNGSPFWETAFGSPCIGEGGDNTMRFETDWFDADGLPFGTGGPTNSPPILGQPADMAVPVGEPASQTLEATDADRQPVTFSKASGPPYVTVTTTDFGSGSAIGKVFVAPHVGDVGQATVMVSATDGVATDQRSFAVTVTTSPNHEPAFTGTGKLDVVAGTTRRIGLSAIDPDGQPLAFSKIDGPDFAQVSTLSSGAGAGAGSLRLTPALCDAGASAVTIAVSDGVSTQPSSLDLLVRAPSRATPSPPPHVVPSSLDAVAIGDFNSDGRPDVAAAGNQPSATISVFLGRGDGTLDAARNMNVAGSGPSSIAVGDLNGDGQEDLAIAMYADARVVVLIGRGDGSFDEGATLAVVSTPQKVMMADVNGDGNLDLVVPNSFGSTVSLFLGQGGGTFGARRDLEAGPAPLDVAVADFNLDGHLDMAVTNFSNTAHTVTLLLGFGDGTFADRRVAPFAGTPFEILAGDWNWDGRSDLAVRGVERGIVIMLGDGDGGFTPLPEYGRFFNYVLQTLAAEDVNGDGNLDILIGNTENETGGPELEIAYGVGDGTFLSPRDIRAVFQTVATGDMNGDGYPDAVSAYGSQITVWLNDAGGAGAAQARAFMKKSDRVVSGGGPGARTCINVEPVGGSYQNRDLNLTSITLSSEGTGSVSQISTAGPASAEEKDTDRNGIPELSACFARADLAKLFDKVEERQTVTGHLEGALTDGRRFCTKIDLDVDSGHRSLAAAVSPNPLNPRATLWFSTSRDGFVRIRMYDLNGRLVRTLLDQPLVSAGDHQVVIDGRGASGGMLASGIYFYQVEALEGTLRGRFTVLK